MRPELYTHLTTTQKNYVQTGLLAKEKSKGTAYLCWLLSFALVNGMQKFYLNRPFMGFMYFITGGFLYIGTIWDLFTLGSQVDEYNNNLEQQLIAESLRLYPDTSSSNHP